MPIVSVIMPVYNGEKYLAEAVDSILTQTFTDFELLIVDDASQDGSVEIIRSYEQGDDRIRFFQLERNSGSADARNVAIAAASGEYIAGMDCDDVSLPQRLQKQVDFLESHCEIGGLGSGRRVVNYDLSTLLYYYVLPRQHALIALNWFIGSSFMGATLMIRRDFLLAVGGYESGRRAVEDLELVSRLLQETPIRFSNLPENLYIYRRHEQLRSKSPGSIPYVASLELRKGVLKRLWPEAPEDTLKRLLQLRRGGQLGWAERRAAKRDLFRLVESMIAANWVEPEDRPLLISAVNGRLEQASPRLWQQFCHWRRHHFQ